MDDKIEKFLTSILKNGLKRQNREFVHLATSKEMAIKVGGITASL